MYVARLTPRDDLPALVVTPAPLPEHHRGAVVHAAVVLVAVERVEVEARVVHHADERKPLPTSLLSVHSTDSSRTSGLNGISFTWNAKIAA
jgi:hypothetical protein